MKIDFQTCSYVQTGFDGAGSEGCSHGSSVIPPHTFHPRRCCCCCLQLVAMPLCEHPPYGVAHCRQELHATISSVVVSRYKRLDSFVVKHIALFLWTTNLEAVSILLLLLMCIYPLTLRPHQFTH